MRQRILTGLLFTLAIFALVIPGFKWPLFPLALLIFVQILAAAELSRAFRAKKITPGRGALQSGSLLILLVPLMTLAGWSLIQTALTLLILVLLRMLASHLTRLIRQGPAGLPTATSEALLFAYLTVPLLCGALILYQVEAGFLWFVVGLGSPWLSDVFAYFVGSLCGRHPIVPHISPKKTLEGFLGGIVGTMLVMGAVFVWLEPHFAGSLGFYFHLAFALAAAMLLSLASQLGDWLASGIKRWCQIKDFGRLLPGHGGILDRFDSTLFTLPLALALAVLYNWIAR